MSIEPIKPTPAAPAVLLPVNHDNTYVLWFRFGSNPHTQPKYFKYEGSFQDAIQRGRKHCELMSLRFIKVERFFSDFTEEERVHQQ